MFSTNNSPASSATCTLAIALLLAGCYRTDGDVAWVTGWQYNAFPAIAASEENGMTLRAFQQWGSASNPGNLYKDQDVLLSIYGIPPLLGRWVPNQAAGLHTDMDYGGAAYVIAQTPHTMDPPADETEGLFITKVSHGGGAVPYVVEGYLQGTFTGVDEILDVRVDFTLNPDCSGLAEGNSDGYNKFTCLSNRALKDGSIPVTGNVEGVVQDDPRRFVTENEREPLALALIEGTVDEYGGELPVDLCPAAIQERVTGGAAHGGDVFLPKNGKHLDLGGDIKLTCSGKDAQCYATDTVEADGCTWEVSWHGQRFYDHSNGSSSVVLSRHRQLAATANATSDDACPTLTCWTQFVAASDVNLVADGEDLVGP